MKNTLLESLFIYNLPSQSMWRAFELKILRELRKDVDLESPTLEIGCGDGAFGALIFDSIDDGIDINPRSLERCRQKQHVYKRIHCMDARAIQFPEDSYRTIFANCVIEHIPDVGKVLEDGYRTLMPGGKFVATLPLKEMNNYLLLRTNWYIGMRCRQLQHVNLLTENGWKEAFRRVGFTEVKSFPYLSGKDCRLWDVLDFPICIGRGRYTVSAVLRLIARTIPVSGRKRIFQTIANLLLAHLNKSMTDTFCATVIIARK